jgi:hypothetical protein
MRYYMHICNGSGFVVDEEGRELADDATARLEAVAAARDVMAGDLREGRLDLASFIEVEDEAHNLLFKLMFGDAVTITDRSRDRL